jgi:hypothetical protein
MKDEELPMFARWIAPPLRAALALVVTVRPIPAQVEGANHDTEFGKDRGKEVLIWAGFAFRGEQFGFKREYRTQCFLFCGYAPLPICQCFHRSIHPRKQLTFGLADPPVFLGLPLLRVLGST